MELQTFKTRTGTVTITDQAVIFEQTTIGAKRRSLPCWVSSPHSPPLCKSLRHLTGFVGPSRASLAYRSGV